MTRSGRAGRLAPPGRAPVPRPRAEAADASRAGPLPERGGDAKFVHRVAEDSQVVAQDLGLVAMMIFGCITGVRAEHRSGTTRKAGQNLVHLGRERLRAPGPAAL